MPAGRGGLTRHARPALPRQSPSVYYLTSIALTLLILTCSFLTSLAQNNVGIGTTTPNPKALLELQATDKGLLVPRLTAVQMQAITTPPNGLLVYNTDENCFNYFNNTITNWKSLCATGIANSGDTVIINLLKVDSLFAHYLKVDSAFITNLFATYIKADNAFIKHITTNYLKADTIVGGWSSFDSLYVDGKNILDIITDSITAQAWLLKGNIAPSNNKLGTLNARDLHIITNNTERISVMSGTGNVGIGQTLPSAKLDVLGDIQFSNDLKPAGVSGTTGQVLTSAGTGVAPTWADPSAAIIGGTGTLTPVIIINGGGEIGYKTAPTQGVMLIDSSNVCWKITISTTGSLITQKVPCP